MVFATFVKVLSAARALLDSAVSAVKSIWLRRTHVTTTLAKTKARAKLLRSTSSDAFAQLVSLVFDVNNVSVIPTHVCTVVSAWSSATPSNANAHPNTLVDAANSWSSLNHPIHVSRNHVWTVVLAHAQDPQVNRLVSRLSKAVETNGISSLGYVCSCTPSYYGPCCEIRNYCLPNPW